MHAAFLGTVKTGYAVQQACLAGAVRSDHRNELTGMHLQVDVVQGPDPPKRRERFEMPSSAVAFSGFRKLKNAGLAAL